MPTPAEILKDFYLTEQDTPPGVVLTQVNSSTLSADIVGFHADLNRDAGGTPTASPLTITVPQNADGDSFIGLYWASGEIPSIVGGNIYPTAANSAQIQLNVVTANADITWVESRLIVMDSAGTDNGNAGVTTGSSVLSTTGIHTLTMTSPNGVITGVVSTDRFCLVFKFNNAQAHSSSVFEVTGVDQFIAWNDDKAIKGGYTEMYSYGLTRPTSELGTEIFATNFSNGRGLNSNQEVDLREAIENPPQNAADVTGTTISVGGSESTDLNKQQSHASYIEFATDSGA